MQEQLRIYSVRYFGVRAWSLVAAPSLNEARGYGRFLGRFRRLPDWAIEGMKVRRYTGVPKRLVLVPSIIKWMMQLEAAAE